MIELRHIHKTYPGQRDAAFALRGINLTVTPGEVFGVIGRSGAGKSTLIRCVNLLERPDSGSVRVGGRELTALSAAELRRARHNIGMVFQHFNLLSTRTAFENIALPLQLLGQSRKQIQQTVMPLLELTGLRALQHAYPHQLSGGQKQRVAIARALATKPNVLLCDEMTSALDPETTQSILKLIADINAQMQLSILLITHEMQVIKTIADQVAVIDQGEIIECGDVVQVFCNPQTEVARALVHTVVDPQLPAPLQARLQTSPVANGLAIWRIAFVGQSARQPVIDYLIRHFAVEVNILQANLELLHHETLGVMLVEVSGQSQELTNALHYLHERQIQIEVLGYVSADDWPLN